MHVVDDEVELLARRLQRLHPGEAESEALAARRVVGLRELHFAHREVGLGELPGAVGGSDVDQQQAGLLELLALNQQRGLRVVGADLIDAVGGDRLVVGRHRVVALIRGQQQVAAGQPVAIVAVEVDLFLPG